MKTFLILVAVVIVGGLAYYFYNANYKTSSSTTTTTTTTTATANAVSIANMSFQPATLTVAVGTEVTWTNNDSVAHTVTSDTSAFQSGNIDPGTSYKFVFSTAGTYSYHCAIHPSMTATVIVQ